MGKISAPFKDGSRRDLKDSGLAPIGFRLKGSATVHGGQYTVLPGCPKEERLDSKDGLEALLVP